MNPRPMRRRLFFALPLALALTPPPARAGARAWPVKDTRGRTHNLLSHKSVLFFVTTDCPIANGYAPEMRRIAAAYKGAGFRFFLVYTDAATTARDAERHAKEYGHADAVPLLDGKKRLAKAFGATVTPEAALLTPDGKVQYRGRIDDKYVDYGKARLRPTRRDLRLALDAVARGKPVPTPRTRALGCFIPRE